MLSDTFLDDAIGIDVFKTSFIEIKFSAILFILNSYVFIKV